MHRADKTTKMLFNDGLIGMKNTVATKMIDTKLIHCGLFNIRSNIDNSMIFATNDNNNLGLTKVMLF